MGRLLSNFEVSQILKIPTSYIDELLIAARLIQRDFDHYGLCHHTLTTLGRKFGHYNGIDTYDVGELLELKDLEGQMVKFDIIVWYHNIVPYLKAIMKEDMLDYEYLDNYYQYIGDEQYPAGQALKAVLEMRRPSNLSFTQILSSLKEPKNNDDDILF